MKGSRNTRIIFEDEIQKLVLVTENGKTQKLTKRELVLKTLINKAAKGDEKRNGQHFWNSKNSPMEWSQSTSPRSQLHRESFV